MSACDERQRSQIEQVNEMLVKVQNQYHRFRSEAAVKMFDLEKQVKATKQRADEIQNEICKLKSVEQYLNDEKYANELVNEIQKIIDKCSFGKKKLAIQNTSVFEKLTTSERVKKQMVKKQSVKELNRSEIISQNVPNLIPFDELNVIDYNKSSLKRRNQMKKIFA